MSNRPISFYMFHSSDYVKSFLSNKYKKFSKSEREQLAYQNCYRFTYFLRYGEKYLTTAKNVTTDIQPLLLFYCLSQWMKAILLIADPHYPSSTKQLAHGVSTRKRKRQNYSFLKDEVKVQKEGFFGHFSHKVFHVKQFSGECYVIRQLLRKIPNLYILFQQLESTSVASSVGHQNDSKITIPYERVDSFTISHHETIQKLRWHCSSPLHIDMNENDMSIKGDQSFRSMLYHPFFTDEDGHLWFPHHEEELQLLPEILVHYLLLYQLSMVCRYEMEWWGDLFYGEGTNDLAFIESYLHVAIERIPELIIDFLELK
ncbi:YaaC family protein [Texcoconibacillus texcoconensis]|uniref:YaaC-like Protein n=1 Tax=Texcoconibacillus texcoconensis TaxID=1095777 RepID=A0A840QUF9_9BACI|nr:YaaC family protein [Texcoconibacillus texcoconensis]MBB5174943.1 hypothetical protein [Texcoconibacillus texcoconensis]